MKNSWVKFARISCKEGFIDVWQGDKNDNPNNLEPSRLHLNSFHKFYRLNGEGTWVPDYLFERKFYRTILELKDEFPAEEIWKDQLIHSL